MKFKTIEEGWSEIELENGDRLRFKIVVGSVTKVEGKKNPDGSQMYNTQWQLVSFVLPKEPPKAN